MPWLILMAWTALPATATAQDEPDTEALDEEGDFEDIDLLELEVPMVVTAGRREQKLTSVPYAMSVITAKDIRRAGARTIPDALRLVVGVDVAELTSGGSAVSPRGFHGFLVRQVLVLVDGRQLFDSHFGGTVWSVWPFQIEDIARIEVIRGPGGVIWGANAVNGVINIITKDPGDQLGLTMTAGGGTRGSFHQYVGYGFKDDKLRLRISGEYEANDGFRTGGSFLRSLDDEYKAGRIGVHAVYEASEKDRFTLSAGHSSMDGGFPTMPLVGLGLSHNSGGQASFLMGTWTRDVAPDNRIELTAYVNDFGTSPGVPAMDYRYQQIAFQFGQTFVPAEGHRLTWGIDSRLDLLDATNSDPHMLSRDYITTGVVGVYVQDQWQLAKRWSLDLGARIDYEAYGGFQPSARAALSYELSDHEVIYGAVSRAFQMPPAGLRFVTTPILNGLTYVEGDRTVNPETLLAFELGYRGRLFECLDASLNFFWHEFDDLTTITPRLGPPGLLTMDFDNRARASMYGAELELKYAVTRDLTLLGNYTYQQLDWYSTAPMFDKDAISAPKHKAMIGATYSPTPDLHLSSYLWYVDAVEAPNSAFPFLARHIDPYFRLDVRAELDLWDDRVSIAVGAKNLLDPEHAEGGTVFLNEAEVPRMVYAEVRFAIP